MAILIIWFYLLTLNSYFLFESTYFIDNLLQTLTLFLKYFSFYPYIDNSLIGANVIG